MAKFDLKGMLSERSAQEIDLPEQKTVYRDPEDLIPSKDNFYSTEDTEKLKQSIRALGILQPLLIEERDGKELPPGWTPEKKVLPGADQGRS